MELMVLRKSSLALSIPLLPMLVYQILCNRIGKLNDLLIITNLHIDKDIILKTVVVYK
jgi:positive regulator of sigma E activity